MITRQQILKLLETYETPFYLYDGTKIKENCRRITTAFRKYYPSTEIHYAVKANNCPGVLDIIKESGLKVDCSSPFELAVAQKTGFPKNDIMYTGNYESTEDLEHALNSAGLINLDDITSFDRLENIGLPQIISFRINPGIGKGGFEGVVTGGVDAKFGIPYEKALPAYKKAHESGIKRFGIHMMTGSNNLEPFYFAEITDKLMHIAGTVFGELKVKPEYIDIGGGFGIPYKNDEPEIDMDTVAKLVTERFIENCKKYGFGTPVLRLEPGRYITGNAGMLITKITGHKSSYRNYVGVDAGMNTLLRPALYDAFHRIEPLVDNGSDTKKTDVCGRICENSDIFARGVRLPEMKTGDIVIFRDCGAYGYTMSSNYNGRPKAGEIVLNGSKTVYARPLETLEKMISSHFQIG
jgi:diaminopimelate decarboxylase